MTDAYDAAWLPGDVYDALRAQDFQRFCAAGRTDLAAHVPTCPEWDVAALCDHLARVYQGRAYAIEHAVFLERDRFERRGHGVDPIAWVQQWSDVLDRALLGRGDDALTVTFMKGVTSVYFWRRRMALETLVHRTDAEIAVGVVSPMDDALSEDGVDELLWFLAAEWDDEPAPTDDYGDVTTCTVLTDGATRWPVTLTATGATRETTSAPDATVRGTAPALLLALSGRDLAGIGAARFGIELPVVDGDAGAYDRLLARIGGF